MINYYNYNGKLKFYQNSYYKNFLMQLNYVIFHGTEKKTLI